MKKLYLIRLDDACPTMNHQKWDEMESLLDKYSIKPMVGVIPHNEDDEQKIDDADPLFWQKVKGWEQKGWSIALHGYNHCYTSDGGLKGLNPMWSRSEFSGLPLKLQKQKIQSGISILREHGINPKFFFAPSHTYDENTLVAIKEETDIRIISDTIALKPYKLGEFTIIPQIGGRCVKMRLPGIYTFCFHPNVMGKDSFKALNAFLKSNIDSFSRFDDLDLDACKEKSMFDKLVSYLYFTYRKLKKN